MYGCWLRHDYRPAGRQAAEPPEMRTCAFTIATALAFAPLATPTVQGQIYDTNDVVVQTFAGSGFSGCVDGLGQQTMFNHPSAVVADSSSNLFVLDAANYRIRRIAPDGTVSTFAGGGIARLPGYGTNVSLLTAVGIGGMGYACFGSMTIDHANVLWITMSYSYNSTLMLRIGPDSFVSAITSSVVPAGLPDIVIEGSCVDSLGNVYLSTAAEGNPNLGNQILRYRTDGDLEVFAGSGNTGWADGNGMFTSFDHPAALACDSADNIYVWDSGNKLVRKITQNRDVITIAGRRGASNDADGAGTNASFYQVSGMCAGESGDLYLTCHSASGGYSVRKMTATTNVTTLAGTFGQSGSYTNGAGSLARFDAPDGICFSRGQLFVADYGDHRIRQISFNPSAEPVSGADLVLDTYPGLTIVGLIGRTYEIQSSTDMTNFTTRATLLLTSSPFLWIDKNPVRGTRFYRAYLLP